MAGRYQGLDLAADGPGGEVRLWRRVDYDAAGRIGGIRSNQGDFSYDYETASGRLKRLTSPVHAVDYRYDDATGRRLEVTNTTPAGLISSVRHGLDALGRIEHTVREGPSAATVEFARYDTKGQVIGVERFTGSDPTTPGTPLHPFSHTYQYDAIGNREWWRIGAEAPEGPLSVFEYGHSPLNRLASVSGSQGAETILHDVEGNLTEDGTFWYDYDAENRLVRAEPKAPAIGDALVEFSYDYRGRRLSKTVAPWDASQGAFVAATVHHFVYSGWNVIEEVVVPVDDAPPEGRSVTYLWGLDDSGSPGGAGGAGGLLSSLGSTAAGSDASPRYYLYDGNANVTEVLDGWGAVVARYAYDPYGQEVLVEEPWDWVNPFRFSGHYTDVETGLVYYGYRYYQARLGVWMSRDPVGPAGGENLHAFLENDPVNGVDYLGLANYRKADVSGQLAQAWSDGAAAYASYGAADWAGWGVQQIYEFKVGLAIGVAKGAGDIASGLFFLAAGAVEATGQGIGLGAAYLFGGEDVRAYLHDQVAEGYNELTDFFAQLSEQFAALKDCYRTECCRKSLFHGLGVEGGELLLKLMDNPGRILGEMAGEVGLHAALAFFTAGKGTAIALAAKTKASSGLVQIASIFHKALDISKSVLRKGKEAAAKFANVLKQGKASPGGSVAANRGATFEGRIYRAPYPGTSPTVIDKYNIAANHRYSAPGEGALYFSTNSRTVVQELGGSFVGGRTMDTFNVRLGDLLDLSNPSVHSGLGVSLDDLVRTSGSDIYDITHQLGR